VFFTLPSQYYFFYLYGDGTIRCRDSKSNQELFLDAQWKEITNPLRDSTDTEEHHIQYRAIAPKRFLKLVNLDNGHFDPDSWKGDHHRVVQRQPEWEQFLKEYDLIGMSRTRLIELLGTGVGLPDKDDRYTYALAYYCTGGSFVVVQMKHDKVDAWSLWEDGKQKSEWYRTNVVIAPNSLEVAPKVQ
jgi:hypothetical protein